MPRHGERSPEHGLSAAERSRRAKSKGEVEPCVQREALRGGWCNLHNRAGVYGIRAGMVCPQGVLGAMEAPEAF
ncbi:MAG: hypothetical protein EA364_14885 [Balneolaceae bacterium]|nr:MAG: hypothetical protein EA364_14885 [Balneolaceae bacterium]